MKIAILDLDHGHNLKLAATFKPDPKIQVVVLTETDELLNVLNGNASDEIKKNQLEKSYADGQALLARTAEGISNLQKALTEKKALLTQVASAPGGAASKKILEEEIEDIRNQESKSVDMKTKLEIALVKRKSEIQEQAKKILKEEDRKVDLVLVDRSFLGNLPSAWVSFVRKGISLAANTNVPIATMGYNENIDYIKTTLVGGAADYFIKPIDSLLLRYGVSHLTGIKSDEGKVYELQTKTNLKILKVANVTKMSEFQVQLQSDAPFSKDELVEFHADIFGGGPEGGRILARCDLSSPDQTVKGQYNSTFSLVGLTPHLMYELRKWLRAQYVSLKKEES